ncbi:histidine phosphatase family protein [Mycolicibacterium sp. Dal123E01]|uniref:histidine phosphatase family protein n=1 Tax=Mycolicibacterium sp. Dal123E01 TaxID=3457578 RepID=UPI00403EF05C
MTDYVAMELGMRKAVATVVSVVALLLMSALPAWAADSITLTWVRHGQSYGNIPGAKLDTSVPGPELTELGKQQAVAIAQQLKDGNYDSIYVSDMIRTQQTAAPLEALKPLLPVHVEGGFRETAGGIFEGSSVDSGLGRIGYFLLPAAWTLGLRSLPIPGGESGNGFEARVDGAIDDVIAGGDTTPVIFSHAGTIMAWTMMNVDNPNLGLALSHPLGNTAVVVVTGNPEDGWTLVSWDGIAVDPNPSLVTKLFVNARNLIVAPQTAVYNVAQAAKAGDVTKVFAAIRDGVVTVAKAGVDFVRDSITDIAQAIRGALPGGAAANTVATKVKSPAAAVTNTVATTDPSGGNKAEPGKSSVRAGRSASTGTADSGAKNGTGSSNRAHKAAA